MQLVTKRLYALAILLCVGLDAGATGARTFPTDIRPEHSTRGTLWLHGDNGAARPAPTVATDVALQVSGLVVRAQVRQRFINPGTAWAEGIYVFPLSADAAVDRLRIRIGERVIEGQIHERAQATARYQQAKAAGQRAALLTQERPNVFTSAVANIPPGATIEVEIEYQQTLHYTDGRFSLRFPLVVAPRYIPGTPLPAAQQDLRPGASGWALHTDAVPDAARITPPVAAPGERHDGEVSLRVDLHAGLPVHQIESLYHTVTTQQRDDGGMEVALAGPVPANRDFVLSWAPEPGQAPAAAVFRERHGANDYALLMVMPPRYSAPPRPVARELIFVLDISGSMHGESIRQARAALRFALARLSAADRFNVIWFNDRVGSLFASAVPAGASERQHAQQWIDGLRADGGTEMAPALRQALQTGETQAAVRQVVFLTDGAVGNEQQLFDIIRTQLGASRLFTVGIGSAPNSHFMREAARAGRGTSTYIGDPNEVGARMTALLTRLEQPALTDIRVETADGAVLSTYPDPVPDLYLGEPVVLTLRAPSLPAQLTLHGRRGEQPWQASVDLTAAPARPGIAALWARRRIAALMETHRRARSGADREAARAAVVRVATTHHLVSRFTSLVAIDTTPARAEAPLHTHAIKTALPDGWTHAKVFGMSQTATPAGLQLTIGVTLLVGAALLGRLLWGPGSWRRRG